MFGIFKVDEKPLPVKKTGSKSLDKKVEKALKKSGGNCVNCMKRPRKGHALFCRKCLN